LDISEDRLTSTSHKKIISSDIENIFNLIGKKFSVDILLIFHQKGVVHFNEILFTIDGINNKTLSARLKSFFDYELIERKIIPGIPTRIEYHFTQKGRNIINIIDHAIEFSHRYDTYRTSNKKLKKSNLEDSSADQPFKLRY